MGSGGAGSMTSRGRGAAQPQQPQQPQTIADIAKQFSDGDWDEDANKQILDIMRNSGFNISDSDYKTFAATYETIALAESMSNIKELEDKYGAFSLLGREMKIEYDSSLDGSGTIAWARSDGTIGLGAPSSNITTSNVAAIKDISTGWLAGVNGGETEIYRSTTTHEYGHIIAYALYYKDIRDGNWSRWSDGDIQAWYAKQRNEVIRIAKANYGYTGGTLAKTNTGSTRNNNAIATLGKSLSRYGVAKKAEFFSEAFVQGSQGDGPIGRAYMEWLASKM